MRMKEDGLIRAGGLSNFELDGLKAAAKAGPIDALQYQFNMLQRQVEPEILPYCTENDIAFVPWGPIAYGVLGGKYTRDFELGENDWRHRSGVFGDAYARNMDIVDGLRPLSKEWDIPLAHLAVRWLLAKPGVGSVITGAKTTAQVEDNVAASSAELSLEQLAQLEAVLQR